jgi:predicted ATP-dependent protease
LKRALRAHRLKIESIGQALQMVSILTLEPEPLALDLKVVIVGEPQMYYLLAHHDPEFSQLFKVAADFDERIDRDEEGRTGFVRMIAGLVREHELPAFDKGAVARVIEAASRGVDDSEKLSLRADPILDLLRESTYWSRAEKHERVEAEDVQKALDARIHRADRYRLRIQEEILRGTLLVDTAGEKVGQINGLSVLTLGETRFGRPTRILFFPDRESADIACPRTAVWATGPTGTSWDSRMATACSR